MPSLMLSSERLCLIQLSNCAVLSGPMLRLAVRKSILIDIPKQRLAMESIVQFKAEHSCLSVMQSLTICEMMLIIMRKVY